MASIRTFVSSVWNISLKNNIRQLNSSSQILIGKRFCSTQSSDNDDLPDPTIQNPFLKEKRQCILCRYNIQVDYKNVRLLSQFVSPFTGRLYDKHITGLCEKQHRALKKEFLRSVRFGLMSPFYRDPKYVNNPNLFDPIRPQRPNPY